MLKRINIGAEQVVSHMLLDMGLLAHLEGFRFLRSAVIMAHEDMNTVGSVTKLLYPELAKRYRTSNDKIERAIRSAIDVSWERGNKRTFHRLFGYSMEDGLGKPTNSEYIATLADEVRKIQN